MALKLVAGGARTDAGTSKGRADLQRFLLAAAAAPPPSPSTPAGGPQMTQVPIKQGKVVGCKDCGAMHLPRYHLWNPGIGWRMTHEL